MPAVLELTLRREIDNANFLLTGCWPPRERSGEILLLRSQRQKKNTGHVHVGPCVLFNRQQGNISEEETGIQSTESAQKELASATLCLLTRLLVTRSAHSFTSFTLALPSLDYISGPHTHYLTTGISRSLAVGLMSNHKVPQKSPLW